jgi:hypothetical protein
MFQLIRGVALQYETCCHGRGPDPNVKGLWTLSPTASRSGPRMRYLSGVQVEHSLSIPKAPSQTEESKKKKLSQV